jgi:hypothetical protein
VNPDPKLIPNIRERPVKIEIKELPTIPDKVVIYPDPNKKKR